MEDDHNNPEQEADDILFSTQESEDEKIIEIK
jgi:hypothetical protein